MTFVDSALARRLERTEAMANAASVEARSRLEPDVGACFVDVGGTWAMFDGPASPLTQSFGFGLFSSPTDEQLDVLEAFFVSRGAHPVHEVSPLADSAHLALLHRRGYAPVELTTQLVRSTAVPPPHAPGAVTVRIVDPPERGRWIGTSTAGWAVPGAEALCRSIARVVAHSRDTALFTAERDGEWVGTAAARVGDGVCLLSGASTVPSARRQGVQHALLAARLTWACAARLPLASMCAVPGSDSQRNAERAGFQVTGTRLQWRKQLRAP